MVVSGGLGATPVWVDGAGIPIDDELVEGVFEVTGLVRQSEKTATVGFVFREKPRRVAVSIQPVGSEQLTLRNGDVTVQRQRRLPDGIAPRPRVAEPQLGKDMQVGGFRSTVVDGDPDQDVRWRVLRVFRDHIEVAVAFKHAAIDKLELRILFSTASILLDESGVRKLLLRVLVEAFQVRMRGRRVQVVVGLLDVFAMVPLAVGQAKQPFLQDRVASVPQGDSETEDLLLVTDAHDAVLAPPVGAP